MSVTIVNRQVTDEELRQYASIVYDRTGIRISPQKKTLLSNRLRRRMKELDIECYDEYYRLLLKVGVDDPEWDAFLQEITTHETYLFRDPNQWEWFAEEFLPEIQTAARKGMRKRELRVWSAACSTGDEVCTIACCIAAKLANHSQWKIEIVGTDIGVGALEEARQAQFGSRAMQQVPESYRRRFFSRNDDQTWTAKPVLREWMEFRQHNLMEKFKGRTFDIVFVKNVLIYFDAASKERVFGNIDSAMAPGGLVVTGPAEGISDLLRKFERIHPWLHRKPIS